MLGLRINGTKKAVDTFNEVFTKAIEEGGFLSNSKDTLYPNTDNVTFRRYYNIEVVNEDIKLNDLGVVFVGVRITAKTKEDLMKVLKVFMNSGVILVPVDKPLKITKRKTGYSTMFSLTSEAGYAKDGLVNEVSNLKRVDNLN